MDSEHGKQTLFFILYPDVEIRISSLYQCAKTLYSEKFQINSDSEESLFYLNLILQLFSLRNKLRGCNFLSPLLIIHCIILG